MKLLSINQKTRFIHALSYSNLHCVPCITKAKLTLSLVVSKPTIGKLMALASCFELISFQRPCLIRAQRSLIFYKIRKGQPLGCKVSLRKANFEEFWTLLLWRVLPNLKHYGSKLRFIKNMESVVNVFHIIIPALLDFPQTQKFYSLINALKKIIITVTFKQTFSQMEAILVTRALKMPQ